MNRSTTLIPRLLILAAVSLFICFALDPLLRLRLTQVVQQATGSSVDIQQLVSSLPNKAIRLKNVQVADPENPGSNLFSAKQVMVKLNPLALLQRRYIIDYSEATGVHLGNLGSETGRLDEAVSTADDSDHSNASGQLIAALTNEGEFETLKTVQQSRELTEQWPQEYQSLETRAEQNQAHIQQLKELSQAERFNPLRKPNATSNFSQRFEQAGETARQLKGRLKVLETKLQADRVALENTRQNENSQIDVSSDFDADYGDTLAEELLTRQLSPHLATVVDWIHQIRSLVPAGDYQWRMPPPRGSNIQFAIGNQVPQVSIHRLLVEGTADVSQQPIRFSGIATNVVLQPGPLEKPAVIVLKIEGAFDAQVHATVQQSASSSRATEIVIDCPQLHQPLMSLGHSEGLGATIPPGVAHLWLHIKVSPDNRLEGRIIYKRDDVLLQPALAETYTARLLTDSWRNAFASVKNLHLVVSLSGQLDNPHWNIETNLGQQLADGANLAVHAEWTAKQTQLSEKLCSEIDGNMQNLSAEIALQRRSILNQLELNFGALQAIGDRIGLSNESPTTAIGRREVPGQPADKKR
ncbi:MAG: TIGR03545 family protein [Planctomycetales bacterium]